MPLRDHFRPPLNDRRSWEGFHACWPAMIVAALGKRLPQRYIAEPRAHLGSSMEVDVATFDDDYAAPPETGNGSGGVATLAWAPPRPTLAVADALSSADEYEVRVYDMKKGRRLVAAVEIVSPSNKDRPDHRRAFLGKCVTLIQNRVCVAVVDVVTTRSADFYRELLDLHGAIDPSWPERQPPLYTASCRSTYRDDAWFLETWAHPLSLGQPLPTLPLWVADDFAVPLDLEESYEESCRVLRIP